MSSSVKARLIIIVLAGTAASLAGCRSVSTISASAKVEWLRGFVATLFTDDSGEWPGQG